MIDTRDGERLVWLREARRDAQRDVDQAMSNLRSLEWEIEQIESRLARDSARMALGTP